MSADAVVKIMVEDIKNKWIDFVSQVDPSNDFTLASKITVFSMKIRPYLISEYGDAVSNDEAFWLLYKTAIIQSKLNGYGETLAAFDESMRQSRVHKKFDKLLAPLNTKIKRVGAVILAIGLLLLTIGSIQLLNDVAWPSYFFPYLWESLSLSGRRYHDYWMAAQGVYLTCLGLMLSYAYDRTTGRLIKWIKSAPS